MSLRLYAVCAVAAVVVGVYVDRSARAEYKQDDFPAFVHHPAVQQPLDLRQIAVAPYFGDAEHTYIRLSRPVATLSFALEKASGFDSPRSRYLHQLALYLLCAVGITLLSHNLALRWRPPRQAAFIALASGLLFALHPAHVEVVMMAAYRPELLALLGELVAFQMALRVADGRGRWPQVLVAGLGFAFALWSKEQALMLLPVVLVWALTSRLLTRRLAALLGVWLLIATGWLWWRHSVFGGLTSPEVSSVDNPLAAVDAVTRVRTALAIASRGFLHLMWPMDLAPDYTANAWPPLSKWSPEAVGGGLGLGAMAVSAALLWIRARQNPPKPEHPIASWPLLGAALAWTLASWLPVSNLAFASTTLYADRLLFAPSVALALAAPWAVVGWRASEDLPRLFKVLPWLALIPLSLWLLESRSVAAEWTTELRLFDRGVRLQPASMRMQHNLALALKRAAADLPSEQQETLLARAWTHHRRAWQGKPDAPTFVALGLEIATQRRACDDGDDYARALAQTDRPALIARRTAIDWTMRCQKWTLGWEVVRRIPPSALRQQQPLDVFAIGVAAGDPTGAANWAQTLVSDPWHSPAWVSAAAFGAERAGHIKEARQYAVTLQGLRVAPVPDGSRTNAPPAGGLPVATTPVMR